MIPFHLLPPITVILFFFVIDIPVPSQQRGSQPTYAAVQEILNDNCIMCHSGPKAPKGLQLTTYELVMKGSESGAVVKPNEPESSEIVKRLRGISKPRMPFGGDPLAEDAIKLIEDWIATGARGEPALMKTSEPKPFGKDRMTFSDVQSIFKMRCQRCHMEKGLMGPAPEGFMVSTYEAILDSRERARIVPGNPAASELVRKIRGQSLPRMPFDGPPYLSDEEIAQIERWIEQGAADDRGQQAPIPVGARVRLRGRMTDALTLDDLPLQSLGRVDSRKVPAAGDYVELRGRVRGDGTIDVERIRRR